MPRTFWEWCNSDSSSSCSGIYETASSDLVIITGGAGTGKSRLMLEVGDRFTRENPSFSTWCIFRRGPDLSRDLQVYFSKPGCHLILVDDANRLSGLDYVLQFLHEQTEERKVKIVATVRDYAREKVAEEASKYGGGAEVHLQPFEDEQITTLISDEAGIKHYKFQKRILDLSQGNPRLAMMAAKIAIEKRTLESIFDVSDLYDEYFKSIREHLEKVGTREAIKVAGIISFFRAVDRSNQEQMDLIYGLFDVSAASFWNMVHELHKLEVLDLYENEIAKFSDQIAATYLFYLAAFKYRVIDFALLLDYFFPRYKAHFIDALSPVLNAMGASIEEQLRPHVEKKWRELKASGHESAFVESVLAFWFVNPTQALLYIRDELQTLPSEEVDLDALDFTKEKDPKPPLKFLELIGHLRYSHFTAALDLLLDAFEKAPQTLLGSTIHILVEGLGHKAGLNYQRGVIDQLWARADGGRSLLFSRLFFAVARHYIQTTFNYTEPKGRMAISIVTIKLEATPELHEFRSLILGCVFRLFSVPSLQPDILGFLHKYTHSGYQISGKEIVEEDAKKILPFMLDNLDPNEYEHVDIVQTYLGFLRREGVEYDRTILDRFTNDLSVFAELLLIERHLRTGRTWEESESWQDEQIGRFLEEDRPEDYLDFFRNCRRIVEAKRQPEQWTVRHGLEKVFSRLLESDSKTFEAVLRSYLDMGNPFRIVDWRLTARLIELLGIEETYSMLSRAAFEQKIQWLFGFFFVIPDEQVTSEHGSRLLELYRAAPPNEVWLNFERLERYLPLDPKFILRVVELLLSRMEGERDTNFVSPLSRLLYTDGLTIDKLLLYFGRERIDTIKRLYLTVEAAEEHYDYNGRFFTILLDLDPGFLFEYIDIVAAKALESKSRWLSRFDHKREYDFLWRRDDHPDLIRKLMEHLLELQETRGLYLNDYPAQIFLVKLNGDLPERFIAERRLTFLKDLVSERAGDSKFMALIFSIASELSSAERHTLIAAFLDHNRRVEDFRLLPLEAHSGAFVGSIIPVYQEKVGFLESILPLVQASAFLDHRLYLEERIDGIRRAIEAEKRHEFLRD